MFTDVTRGSIEMKKRIRGEALFNAGRTIYSRGLRYFKQGNVFELRLRPEKNNPESQIAKERISKKGVLDEV